MREIYDYALYKGDKFIDLGTIKEISARQGMSPNTLRFYAQPVQRRRVTNGYIVIKVEGDNE